jgi:ATP-dependent Clp protease adaptor protein ClpS
MNMAASALPEIHIIEESKTDLEPFYRVVIHNDNLTPMDFVVHVLKTIFFLSNDRAAEIMLTAHIKGNAYVQTLPKPEAEKRVQRAHFDANNAGYPLKFTMEPE